MCFDRLIKGFKGVIKRMEIKAAIRILPDTHMRLELSQQLGLLHRLEQLGIECDQFKYDFVFSHFPLGPLRELKLEDPPLDFSKIYKEARPTTFYIHIPFCSRSCKYCYFIKKAPYLSEDIDEYLGYLEREFNLLNSCFKHWGKIGSIYIGGGTPSVLNENQLKRLINNIVNPIKNQIGKKDIEVAMELHPEDMTEDKLKLLKDYGITRISFGIQTFDEEILKKLGRSNKNYEDAIKNLKRLHFKNWNLDMILGLPYQKLEHIKSDLNEILKIDPPSITWYQLWFAPRKKDREILLKEISKDKFMSRKELLEAKILIHNTLTEKRYINISGEWYVKKDIYYTKYEHFKITAEGNIGIGLGIYGYYDKYIFENTSDWNKYSNYIKANRLPIQWIRELNPLEIFIRKTLMGLKGLENPLDIELSDFQKYKKAAQQSEFKSFFEKLDFLIDNGIFKKTEDKIILNCEYYLLRDYIIMFLVQEKGWYVEKETVLESLTGIDVYGAVDEFRKISRDNNYNFEYYSIAFFAGTFNQDIEDFILNFSNNYIKDKHCIEKIVKYEKIPEPNSFSFLKNFYLPPSYLSDPVCIIVSGERDAIDVPNIALNKISSEIGIFLKSLSLKNDSGDNYDYVVNYYNVFLKEQLQIKNDMKAELYVFHIPFFPRLGIGGIELAVDKPLSKEEILGIRRKLLPYFTDRLSMELDKAEKHNLYKHALRTAVAAIMARNMSHNIGSHVLARLVSHGIDGWTKGKGVDEIIDSICTDDDNIKSKEKRKSLVYWSKDVQNLLKYLQQRQDFLAMVSTEWPEWTDVAYLMQDIMRWFFYQKQILDNIAASEGLSSHNYEKENNKDNYEKENNKDIRFHVFLVPEKLWGWQACSVYDRFNQIKNNCVSVKDQEGELGCNSNNNNCPSCRRVLLYTDEKTGSGRLSDDIQVAVPGGVIGYHAFYVLLENIIRNAAKHSFEGSSETHLDVVIEILYDPEEKIGINIKGEKRPAYLFRIYNNVGKAQNDKILLWSKKENGEIKKGINDYLGTPLIDETGKLKKECWGMAEMKIAAGFLQGRDIEQIGAGGDKIYGPYGSDKNYNFLKLAETEEGSTYIIRAIESPLGTLGYEFYVRKPKMLGILCKKEGNENGTM
jgi:oxygen-independent coproporphyrinogen-3 oxidase